VKTPFEHAVAWARTVAGHGPGGEDPDLGRLAAEVERARAELEAARASLATLRESTAAASRVVEQLIADRRHAAAGSLRLAGVPMDTLRSSSLVIEGKPSQRLRMRRLAVGDVVRRSLARAQGVMSVDAASDDVRALWDRLLQFERASGDDAIEGAPAAVLDVPGADVSAANGVMTVSLRDGVPPGPTIAIPRFTYAAPARKQRNFGHWLLDCVPQVQALLMVEPDARCLLPEPLKPFHLATLALTGMRDDQIVPWNGAAVTCGRALVLQHDGRSGGGRPLSPLLALRRRVAGSRPKGSRRIYVARRDARASRTWVTNEADVETLFRRRGFEVIVMGDLGLDEQVRIFQDAAIVAGVSGAGLSDIVFSPPGTHVIVLTSDSLVRWYAEDTGARSLWATGDRAGGGQLAALGDSPRFYVHLAAAFEQVCHSFVTSDDVPLAALDRFLDDALAWEGRTPAAGADVRRALQ
jgi:capsular polysaccharide biosynthesis protein